MGKSISKPGENTASIEHLPGNPNSRAIIIKQSDQDSLPAKSITPFRDTPSRQDETLEGAEQCRSAMRETDCTDLLLSSPVDGQTTSTYIGTESSPISYTHRLGKRRQFSEIESKPLPPWDNASPTFEYPGTNKPVFKKGYSRNKQALEIICPNLRQLLRQMAADLPGTWDNDELSSPACRIVEPYELIFHNTKKIKERTFQFGDGDAKEHLQFLLEKLEREPPDVWGKYSAIQSGDRRAITFEELSLLYPPGATVLRNDDGAWRAYVVERREESLMADTKMIQIHVRYLDFDSTGKFLVPHAAKFEINAFTFERPISTLELIPQWFFDRNDIVDQIIARGACYFQYGEHVSYCGYCGDEWPKTSHEWPIKVIIDYVTSSRYTGPTEESENCSNVASCYICVGDSLSLFSHPRGAPHDRNICLLAASQAAPDHKANSSRLESHFFFCPPRLWAFSLQFKSWKRVSPYDLAPIQRQDQPFDNGLWMDSEKKKYLNSFISEYMNRVNTSKGPDILGRTGRGLNILLCGKTGTGKTLTAECLSEKYGMPLYTMTCGDLGVEPLSLDQKLHATLLRGINWNAIILLDEVDIYVYDRDRHSPQRSALAPIFLRHLESSTGLNLITMTHSDNLDPAFKARIHLPLCLPDFNIDAQKVIWRNAIDSIGQTYLANRDQLISFINNEVESFNGGAHAHMNGRQIRNCVNVALIFARNDGSGTAVSTLETEHIKKTLMLGKDFEDYLHQRSRDATDIKASGLGFYR